MVDLAFSRMPNIRMTLSDRVSQKSSLISLGTIQKGVVWKSFIRCSLALREKSSERDINGILRIRIKDLSIGHSERRCFWSLTS